MMMWSGLGYAFFCGALFHALDARVKIGMSGEELIQLAFFLGSGFFLRLFEFLE